jgi:class 3 adenylate cyclase
MVRFARDILKKTQEITQRLEASLGPGTADLSLKAGIHSGPVTAGILRDDRKRLQIFGDSVNFGMCRLIVS